MNEQERKAVIEGLLLAVGEDGLSEKEIAKLLDISPREAVEAIEQLMEEYRVQGRGMQIVKVAQVYQLTTKPEHHRYLEQLATTPRHARLSRAALETLAIVAYRQPITRLQIDEIRGVKSDRLLQTLQRKGLLRVVGRAEGLGRPLLYGTTPAFLEYFGFNHLEELPAPHSIFNWQEWEEEKQRLNERLGME